MKITALFFILTAAAYSASFTLNFTSNATTPTSIGAGPVGNAQVYALSGVNVRVTAWSVFPNTTNTANLFNQARLRDYDTAGLGVCNGAEFGTTSTDTCSSSSTNGAPSEHQVDNTTPGRDFIMFQFSNPTTSAQLLATNIVVTFGSRAGDWDVSYWLGDTPAAFNSLNNVNVNNLNSSGFGSRVDVWNDTANTPLVLNSSTGIVTHQLGNTTGFDTILYGTMLSGTNDGFKLRSISFTIDPRIPTNETIPEPSTYALLGTGLAAMAYFRRKR